MLSADGKGMEQSTMTGHVAEQANYVSSSQKQLEDKESPVAWTLFTRGQEEVKEEHYEEAVDLFSQVLETL